MMASSSVRDDRRGKPRTPAILAVALESERKPARHGVTRDLSANGLLIVTPTHFEKGDRLKIKVHAGAVGLDVVGRVARVDENPISSPELWRYRVGVELDEPLPVNLVEARRAPSTAKA
ncbi:MAG: PilZ domain-containing protein [Labilithrix sp.]|nr:PilZ domain-containing protein [Labilithrix sp.]MBX3221394.1 PilZ domain-containing protein [Labilithrix sp.]